MVVKSISQFIFIISNIILKYSGTSSKFMMFKIFTSCLVVFFIFYKTSFYLLFYFLLVMIFSAFENFKVIFCKDKVTNM